MSSLPSVAFACLAYTIEPLLIQFCNVERQFSCVAFEAIVLLSHSDGIDTNASYLRHDQNTVNPGVVAVLSALSLFLRTLTTL